MMKRSAVLFCVVMMLIASVVQPSAAQTGGRPSVNEFLADGLPVFGFFGDQRAEDGGTLAAAVGPADFVFYSLESGPFDIPGVDTFRDDMHAAADEAGRAAHPLALRIPPIGDDSTGASERVEMALGADVSIVIVPHVRTAAEATAAVGTMSGTGDLWPANAAGGLSNWLIVEDREGVANAEAIAATPGVGAIIAGPGDLSRAYERDMDAVENAIQTILAACKGAGVPCGITAGPADIELRLEQGFRVFIVLDTDALTIGARWRGGEMQRRRVEIEMAEPNPIAAVDSVWIEDLTWIEVRDAQRNGMTTAIVSSGGMEQNGPYLTTGKHNVILRGACEMMARDLGNALCAPILPFVPEGNIDPPSGSMLYPGTISLSQGTFQAVVDDIGSSLRATGFEHIVLIGDSGGNQRGMANAAEAMNARWGETRAHFIPEYYEFEALLEYVADDLGVEEPINEGLHDNYAVTAMMMAVDPATVRYEERVAAGNASINGADITPAERTIEIGVLAHQFRVDMAVAAIRAAIAGAQ
jgi:creatinine amidohydrolase/Fe(II)-dependent formamide hydrolase-like protein